MTRDHLLGFPPVLLAQDDQMPCSNEGLHFPLGIPESAYHDYKSRPEYKRTRELMAFEMLPARPEITEADCRKVKPSAYDEGTFTVASAPVGAEFATAGQSAYTADTASLAGTVATDPHPGASPISDTSGEFKVGDRVRVVGFGGGAVKPGATGVITSADMMQIDGVPLLQWNFSPKWLEHA